MKEGLYRTPWVPAVGDVLEPRETLNLHGIYASVSWMTDIQAVYPMDHFVVTHVELEGVFGGAVEFHAQLTNIETGARKHWSDNEHGAARKFKRLGEDA